MIEVVNPERRSRGVAQALLDGTAGGPRAIPLSDDGGRHALVRVEGSARVLKGMLPRPSRTLSLDEMDAASAQGAKGRSR